MKLITAISLLLSFALAPNSVLGSELVERRAKHSSSSSGSLKGSAANRARRSSSSGKGSKKEDPAVKIVYVPYGYIPVAGGSNVQFVSEDKETSEYVQTPAPSKRPSDAVKIVYVPVTVPGTGTRSRSGDDEQEAMASIKTPVPTKMSTKMPSAKPSVTPSAGPSVSSSATPSTTPSLSPTSAPSATPTTERWCNMEYERGCRDSCFKERGCGTSDTCKKKCRKQCCSWN